MKWILCFIGIHQEIIVEQFADEELGIYKYYSYCFYCNRRIGQPLHGQRLIRTLGYTTSCKGGEIMTNDTFRIEYTPLTEDQQIQMREIKEMARDLLNHFNAAVPADERSERSRCMAVARTNLETTIMWAVKAVTTKQD